MGRYLYQAAYTAASWKTQIGDPRDVRQRIEPLAGELGGRVESVYYCFGEHDVVAVLEFADDEAMAAFALAVAAGGAIAKAHTTKLIEVTAGQAAMRKAGAAAAKYKAPVGELART